MRAEESIRRGEQSHAPHNEEGTRRGEYHHGRNDAGGTTLGEHRNELPTKRALEEEGTAMMCR